MSANNSQVVEAFQQGEARQGRNLLSDGQSLWSYGWWEVARWVDGEIVLRKGNSYSMTTAHHRAYLNGCALRRATEETPAGSSYMNP